MALSTPLKQFGITTNAPDELPTMLWYDLGVFDELVDSSLHKAPQYDLDVLVESNTVTIMRGNTEQAAVLGYTPLLVQYMGVTLAVGQDGFYPYYRANPQNYLVGVSTDSTLEGDNKEHVYLGVEQ